MNCLPCIYCCYIRPVVLTTLLGCVFLRSPSDSGFLRARVYFKIMASPNPSKSPSHNLDFFFKGMQKESLWDLKKHHPQTFLLYILLLQLIWLPIITIATTTSTSTVTGYRICYCYYYYYLLLLLLLYYYYLLLLL